MDTYFELDWVNGVLSSTKKLLSWIGFAALLFLFINQESNGLSSTHMNLAVNDLHLSSLEEQSSMLEPGGRRVCPMGPDLPLHWETDSLWKWCELGSYPLSPELEPSGSSSSGDW